MNGDVARTSGGLENIFGDFRKQNGGLTNNTRDFVHTLW